MKKYHHSFVGIPIPENLKPEFNDVLDDLRKIDPEFNINDSSFPHITLYFLGTQTLESLTQIAQLIENEKEKLEDASLNIHKFGYFTPKNPRVMFVHVTATSSLVKFRKDLVKDLQKYYEEGYKDTLHLTLMRVSRRYDKNILHEKMPLIKKVADKINWTFPVMEIGIFGREVGVPNSSQEKLFSILLN